MVQVVFDPKISYDELLKLFWENHDPTQGMRQGGDARHPVPVGDLRASTAPGRGRASRDAYQAVHGRRLRPITTEIAPAGAFYYAEDYHQQYLAKNPNGYCGIGGTGVAAPSAFEPDVCQKQETRKAH